MNTLTEALQVNSEERLAVIKSSYTSMVSLKPKEIPSVGSVVIIGYQYEKSTLQLAIVEKIDGKGVIYTDTRIRFSTKYHEITSTKKINDRYWQMFGLDKAYHRALEKQEENRIRGLQCKYSDLKLAVHKLDPIAHADLIAQLLESIESSDK